MRGVVQVVLVSLIGVWLAGCVTTDMAADLNKPATSGEETVVEQTTTTTTGPAAAVAVVPPPGSQAGLLGSNPQDDLSLGKKYYRAAAYGLAEKHFRTAVETHANDAEAWLGLAASYDQLRRFDLADRAYAQAIRIAGPTVEIVNNQGYSLMLRGKYREAAAKFAQAARKAPDNPYVKNNIRLLAESTHQKKSIE
jgi:tetratricopeptide (TPR) repeat protein